VSSIVRRHPRACADRRRSRVRSRDGFPLRSGPRRPFASSPARRFRARMVSRWLDPRPRTLPNRVKWRAHASLSPTPPIDFCNELTTREHNLFERPILARPERSALLGPLALRVLPSLPALPLSKRHGVRQPIPCGTGRQRATSASTTFASRRCKHAERWERRRSPHFVPPLAGDDTSPPPVAPKTRRTTTEDCVGRAAWSEGPPLASHANAA
jgi:hypothetical protein